MDPAELRRVFQMFDKNGDGQITKKELSDSLKNLGIYIPDKDLIHMIEKIDVNGDGYVDIEEFGALYQTIMDERDEEEDMREAFNVFDQNGDGFITVEELKSVLSSLGLKQGRTLEDCKSMIKKVDVDGDGMVNFREFKQMMKGGGFAALELWSQPTDNSSEKSSTISSGGDGKVKRTNVKGKRAVERRRREHNLGAFEASNGRIQKKLKEIIDRQEEGTEIVVVWRYDDLSDIFTTGTNEWDSKTSRLEKGTDFGGRSGYLTRLEHHQNVFYSNAFTDCCQAI
ncbi:hypothetical protein SADUNF_Sadunf02G0189700 [Salix dunnii]|uniref:EF-hand domain-containing protein n=1 Tax=Salix dunnii TaxID=1413687 RepID=A0A835N958_9ROSI|nr:hypothetical protein SADUNF_Sadunf02G0189700 [Salix dunnii]